MPQVKIDSQGNVHYEAWAQPHGESTRLPDVLTKPKILPVEIVWERVEPASEDGRTLTRYVLSAATYQRLLDAVPKA